MAFGLAFHPKLYLGESIKEKNLDRIMKRLEKRPIFSGVFVIALCRGKSDQLELYDTLDGTQGARTALLMPDGSAILISADSAGFYIP